MAEIYERNGLRSIDEKFLSGEIASLEATMYMGKSRSKGVNFPF
jgi:hypothetical protein